MNLLKSSRKFIIVNSLTKSWFCSFLRPRQKFSIDMDPNPAPGFPMAMEGTGGDPEIMFIQYDDYPKLATAWSTGYFTPSAIYQRMTVDKTEVLHINKLHWFHIEPQPEDVILRFLPCFARPRSKNFR